MLSKGLFIALSVGPWGGFYCHGGRLCLGWVALTIGGRELDDVVNIGLTVVERRRGEKH